ncbi:MAG: B12-binding domain-containing radical SAM protein [Deltaproteobacteria bacterium]|nr:B12-binding domain-containing radical SAM protein [Deltaproteobacteria bacterium]
MRIALVNLVPRASRENYLPFNQGLGMLSAVLAGAGHNTALFHFSRSLSNASMMADFNPDALFVYLATNQYPLFIDLLETWRSAGLPLIVGGPHATCLPEDLAVEPGVTAVCVGEGEPCASEIVARLERGDSFDGIANVWFERDGSVVKNPIGVTVEDLDSLPFVDRSIFPFEAHLGTREMNILGFEFMLSRGCVYPCGYCINPLLASRLKGPRVRKKSPRRAVDEIIEVVRRYEYRGIIGFVDDVFTLDRDWLDQFGEIYRKEVALPFWCNAHINSLDELTVKALRRAGCVRVYVGVECGSEDIRRRVLGKRITNDLILHNLELVKKHHIKLVTYFMLGIPKETEDHVQESIALSKKIAPDRVLLSAFWPYPGTRIYDELVADGYLDPHYYKRDAGDTFYSADGPRFDGRLEPDKFRYYFDNFIELSRAR